MTKTGTILSDLLLEAFEIYFVNPFHVFLRIFDICIVVTIAPAKKLEENVFGYNFIHHRIKSNITTFQSEKNINNETN